MSEGIKELRLGSYCVRYVLCVVDFYFIVPDYHMLVAYIYRHENLTIIKQVLKMYTRTWYYFSTTGH